MVLGEQFARNTNGNWDKFISIKVHRHAYYDCHKKRQRKHNQCVWFFFWQVFNFEHGVYSISLVKQKAWVSYYCIYCCYTNIQNISARHDYSFSFPFSILSYWLFLHSFFNLNQGKVLLSFTNYFLSSHPGFFLHILLNFNQGKFISSFINYTKLYVREGSIPKDQTNETYDDFLMSKFGLKSLLIFYVFRQ